MAPTYNYLCKCELNECNRCARTLYINATSVRVILGVTSMYGKRRYLHRRWKTRRITNLHIYLFIFIGMSHITMNKFTFNFCRICRNCLIRCFLICLLITRRCDRISDRFLNTRSSEWNTKSSSSMARYWDTIIIFDLISFMCDEHSVDAHWQSQSPTLNRGRAVIGRRKGGKSRNARRRCSRRFRRERHAQQDP